MCLECVTRLFDLQILTVRFRRVRSLSIVLQDVEVVLSERQPNSQQQTELKEIAGGCRNVLGKYDELGPDPQSVGKRVK